MSSQQRVYCTAITMTALAGFMLLLAIPVATGIVISTSTQQNAAPAPGRSGDARKDVALAMGIVAPPCAVVLYCLGLAIRRRLLLVASSACTVLMGVYALLSCGAIMQAVITSATANGLGGEEGNVALAVSGGNAIGALMLAFCPCGLALYTVPSNLLLTKQLWGTFGPTRPPSPQVVMPQVLHGVPVVSTLAAGSQDGEPTEPVPVAMPVVPTTAPLTPQPSAV